MGRGGKVITGRDLIYGTAAVTPRKAANAEAKVRRGVETAVALGAIFSDEEDTRTLISDTLAYLRHFHEYEVTNMTWEEAVENAMNNYRRDADQAGVTMNLNDGFEPSTTVTREELMDPPPDSTRGYAELMARFLKDHSPVRGRHTDSAARNRSDLVGAISALRHYLDAADIVDDKDGIWDECMYLSISYADADKEGFMEGPYKNDT